MLKLVISSLVIASTLVVKSASVDWTIDLGANHKGDSYYVIGEGHIYEATFGIQTGLFQDNDWESISYYSGRLNDAGTASFSMMDKDNIFILLKINGGYTWTQPMWSMVGRDLNTSNFDVKYLPGSFNLSRVTDYDSVPEPNSIILMLIGMSFLGLKRK